MKTSLRSSIAALPSLLPAWGFRTASTRPTDPKSDRLLAGAGRKCQPPPPALRGGRVPSLATLVANGCSFTLLRFSYFTKQCASPDRTQDTFPHQLESTTIRFYFFYDAIQKCCRLRWALKATIVEKEFLKFPHVPGFFFLHFSFPLNEECYVSVPKDLLSVKFPGLGGNYCFSLQKKRNTSKKAPRRKLRENICGLQELSFSAGNRRFTRLDGQKHRSTPDNVGVVGTENS